MVHKGPNNKHKHNIDPESVLCDNRLLGQKKLYVKWS